MRIDLEQFMAITVAIGAAGAIGVAVYTNRDAAEEVAPTEQSLEQPDDDDEPFPEADLRPVPAPVPDVAASPAPTPTLDSDPEVLDTAPGPQVEGAAWK